MGVKLKYKSFLAYSEVNQKLFFTEFGDGVSIIYGKNTSGKSTLFLSMLYTFGINDGNSYLRDLLQEQVIFRIDCMITKDAADAELILIRDDETIYVKYGTRPLKRFNGISGNGSVEHVRLKEYLNELFDFSLMLESKNELKVAPIETMFLPYYISQSVGWIYLRKSFGGLEFFKGFKEDYLDYYLGLEPATDRVKRHELEAKLKSKQVEIDTITMFAKNDEQIQLTQLSDEAFVTKSGEYVEDYSKKYESLTELESNYVLKANELAFLEERRSVLLKVRTGLRLQNSENGSCPTCQQVLPLGISEEYAHLQNVNDTETELQDVKDDIKAAKSAVNSLKKSITAGREMIAREYNVLQQYTSTGMSYDRWMKNKANVQLISALNEKIGVLTVERDRIEEDMQQYKTEEEIEQARVARSQQFSRIFSGFLTQLGVRIPIDERYLQLYEISAFPSQGVELHKTILAYHFAFVHLISRTDRIHKFPFMLDAIFKEDIDDDNKDLIMNFIKNHRMSSSQTIISMAHTSEQSRNAVYYNRNVFEEAGKLILIGDGQTERAFLQPHVNEQAELIQQTLNIMTGSNN